MAEEHRRDKQRRLDAAYEDPNLQGYAIRGGESGHAKPEIDNTSFMFTKSRENPLDDASKTLKYMAKKAHDHFSVPPPVQRQQPMPQPQSKFSKQHLLKSTKQIRTDLKDLNRELD